MLMVVGFHNGPIILFALLTKFLLGLVAGSRFGGSQPEWHKALRNFHWGFHTTKRFLEAHHQARGKRPLFLRKAKGDQGPMFRNAFERRLRPSTDNPWHEGNNYVHYRDSKL